jgi:hypothetical protein
MPPEDLGDKLQKELGNIDWDVLENFILGHSSVLRPLVGHCFETYIDEILKKVGVEPKSVGGDSSVDREINEKTIQLKTRSAAKTKQGETIGYELHKTHGKEIRPYNLYIRNCSCNGFELDKSQGETPDDNNIKEKHLCVCGHIYYHHKLKNGKKMCDPDKNQNFAEFLIGEHPKGVIICPRKEIPLRQKCKKWQSYMVDSHSFDWNSKWFDRWDILGVQENVKYPNFSKGNVKFPKIGKLTKLSDDLILETIFKPENFRLLDMNLMGSIREYHFEQICSKRGIELFDSNSDFFKTIAESIPDVEKRRKFKNKVDHVLKNEKKIQVKGRTKSLCKDDQIGVEIKGSHGRIPERLYRKDEVDFFVVVLDPNIVDDKYYPKGIQSSEYNYVVIPVTDIPLHERSEEWGDEYLKDIFKFKITDYPINDLSLLK